MSTKLKLSLIPVSLFLLGWGVASYMHAQKKQTQSQEQFRALVSVQAKSTLMMEKHLMPITLRIQPTEDIPEGPGGTLTVKAYLKTPFENFGPIDYQWVIPSDVDVITGALQGRILNPLPGKTYEVEITLRNFDRQYRKEISMKTSITDPEGMRLSNSGLITSRPEDSMEHLAPVMMVKAQEMAEQNRAPASESNPEEE